MQIMKVSATHRERGRESERGRERYIRASAVGAALGPQLIRQNKLWAKLCGLAPFRVAVSFFQLVKISFIVYDKQTMRQRDSHEEKVGAPCTGQ